jgi:ADP-ribose pyrophosphatase YjhB (NUDIX family)
MIICKFEDGNENSLRHVVTDVLILKENKILLLKRSEKLTEGGKWGLAGGYAERDETIVEAAERETFEESGYKVNDLTLLTIIDNPKRPNEDRQNVSFVYFCEAGEKQGNSDWEVTEQKWFDFSDLPPKEDIAFDHYASIQLYQKYLKNKTSLPIL